MAGGPLPDDQGAVPEEILTKDRPRHAPASGIGDREEAASPPQDGLDPEVHGLRHPLHNDEEEAQLQGLRHREFFMSMDYSLALGL